MDLDRIRSLIGLFDETEVTEIEWEKDGERIRVARGSLQNNIVQTVPVAAPAAALATAAPVAEAARVTAAGNRIVTIASPMPGTFYRAPKPGTPNFADVGATVSKGDVLCIVEAMKLMNEILAEHRGRIISIHVDNEAAVEYGTDLFDIEVLD